MKTKELQAVLQQLKDTVANVNEIVANAQCLIASIEAMLESSNENPKEETPEETPVVNDKPKEVREILPEPPKEIHVKLPEDNTPDNETIIGCAILTKLKMHYSIPCRSITLQWKYYDNSSEINKKTGKLNTEVFRDRKRKIVIVAEDINGESIGTKTVAWDTLHEWHEFLYSRGIFTYGHTNNPHTNGVPRVVSLCID